MVGYGMDRAIMYRSYVDGPGSGLQALIEMQASPIGTVQKQGSRARHGKAEQQVFINAE